MDLITKQLIKVNNMKKVLLALALLFVSFHSMADTSWKNGIGDGYHYSHTTNADSSLGLYCHTSNNTCSFIIVSTAECRAGNVYPINIITKSNSVMVNSTCSAYVGGYGYLGIDGDYNFSDVLTNNKIIVIKLPLSNGRSMIFDTSNASDKVLEMVLQFSER